MVKRKDKANELNKPVKITLEIIIALKKIRLKKKRSNLTVKNLLFLSHH